MCVWVWVCVRVCIRACVCACACIHVHCVCASACVRVWVFIQPPPSISHPSPLSHLQAHDKESVNEDHIKRLQSTIERMLKESNDRMKTHIADRKTLSDERVGNCTCVLCFSQSINRVINLVQC